MVEVLVTIVILSFGLLGLAGMQTRLQVSEMESYQRTQGLILLEDMVSRISANRMNAASYVTGSSSPLGTGVAACTVDPATTRQVQDSCEWNNSLLGTSEAQSSSKIGAMIGARGCVENMGSNSYMVTVAWQGQSAISAPPSAVGCGRNLYNSSASGAVCTDDKCRRVLTTQIHIASLLP
jgi:type IV pilus assembly protein PilV